MHDWEMIEKITKMNDWDKDNLKFLIRYFKSKIRKTKKCKKVD
jgi:hypothetical protein